MRIFVEVIAALPPRRAAVKERAFSETHKFMHFNALIRRTKKAMNQDKTSQKKKGRRVLTRMIMQDRLTVSHHHK
ncbi:MAG: hypothetical protein VB062_02640 [Christensenella sp.]|nr:hypothetical protein [Christensenella sp.]